MKRALGSRRRIFPGFTKGEEEEEEEEEESGGMPLGNKARERRRLGMS